MNRSQVSARSSNIWSSVLAPVRLQVGKAEATATALLRRHERRLLSMSGMASNHCTAMVRQRTVKGMYTVSLAQFPNHLFGCAKGARLHDWAYLELADLDAGDFNAAFVGVWTRGLLIRRSIADGDLAFFSTWCPVGTSLEKLVTVEGHRWAIEDSFETAKNEFGLDHNETRSWHGWHRHVSLVMLAFAMMAVIRHRANIRPPEPPKTMRSERRKTAN